MQKIRRLIKDVTIECCYKTENFADPLENQLTGIHKESLVNLFETLGKLIYSLNRNGILTVQRTCYGCSFYEQKKNNDYCNLLEKELLNTEIRLDCPEYIEKPIGSST